MEDGLEIGPACHLYISMISPFHMYIKVKFEQNP